MGKRKILTTLAILTSLITAFTFGLGFGSTAELEQQHMRQTLQQRLNTTIAVVNADAGIDINGSRYNYSAAIINTLGADFSLVSPAMAQTGFANGIYGAVVIFPSDVSANILSFNATNPQRVRLEFQINENLPEQDYLETFLAITSLQLSINTTLANTYVSSMLRQFHDAQDQVSGVFQNRTADMMAMDIITLRDFTADLELDEVPHIPLNPNRLDTYFYMGQVENFAQDIAGWYLNSFLMASDQYLWMREGLFSLTEGFDIQQDNWLEQLERWAGNSREFGELMEAYSDDIAALEDDLRDWFFENLIWSDNLGWFQQDIDMWERGADLWFYNAENWHEGQIEHLGQVLEFADAVSEYHTRFSSSINPLMGDINSWKSSLENYETQLYALFTRLYDAIDVYNQRVDMSNIFADNLLDWHTNLDNHSATLTSWSGEIQHHGLALNTWQGQLVYSQEGFESILVDFLEHLHALPTIPDEFEIIVNGNGNGNGSGNGNENGNGGENSDDNGDNGYYYHYYEEDREGEEDEDYHYYASLFPRIPKISLYKPEIKPLADMPYPIHIATIDIPSGPSLTRRGDVNPSPTPNIAAASVIPPIPSPAPEPNLPTVPTPAPGDDPKDDLYADEDYDEDKLEADSDKPEDEEDKPEYDSIYDDSYDYDNDYSDYDTEDTDIEDIYDTEYPYDSYDKDPESYIVLASPHIFDDEISSRNLNEGSLEDLLEDWYMELNYAADNLYELQKDIMLYVEELRYWIYDLDRFFYQVLEVYNQLSYAYYELTDWHIGLEGFADVAYQWQYRLAEQSSAINEWQGFVESFDDILSSSGAVDFPVLEIEAIEIPENELDSPNRLESPEIIEAPAWAESLESAQEYTGVTVYEAFDVSFLVYDTFIMSPLELIPANDFELPELPQVVEQMEWSFFMRPIMISEETPPRPYDFWASLDFMHSQLESFEIGNFLGDDIHARVDNSLQAYENFLGFIGHELDFLFEGNIHLMYDIHAEYNNFLERLRINAFIAAAAEQSALRDAIDEFSEITEANRQNSLRRLGDFASMMPESRISAGINQDLVDFAVAPFDFVNIGSRDHAPFEHLFVEPMTETFRLYQIIAASSTGGILLILTISNIVEYFKRKKMS